MGAGELVKNEKDIPKIGLIVSTLIITLSLIPDIKSKLFDLANPYSFQSFLIGVGMFFFFMGIRLNMTNRIEKIGKEYHSFDVLPARYTPLSKACFWISGVISIIFIIFIFIKLNT